MAEPDSVLPVSTIESGPTFAIKASGKKLVVQVPPGLPKDSSTSEAKKKKGDKGNKRQSMNE